jgi:hypothetical protein
MYPFHSAINNPNVDLHVSVIQNLD